GMPREQQGDASVVTTEGFPGRFQAAPHGGLLLFCLETRPEARRSHHPNRAESHEERARTFPRAASHAGGGGAPGGLGGRLEGRAGDGGYDGAFWGAVARPGAGPTTAPWGPAFLVTGWGFPPPSPQSLSGRPPMLTENPLFSHPARARFGAAATPPRPG